MTALDTEALKGVLADCAQLLDAVKMEWSQQNAWSEWDQSVRDNITAQVSKLYALSALPAQPVAVKPLKWQKRKGRDEWFADCDVGRYEVGDVRLRVAAVLRHVTGNDADDDTVGRFDTFDLAKAAAQADYEHRIRSALAAPSRQEGVTEEMVEVAAEAVYEHWQFGKDDPQLSTMKKPAWAPSGNSNRQNEARNYARAALEAALVDRDQVKP